MTCLMLDFWRLIESGAPAIIILLNVWQFYLLQNIACLSAFQFNACVFLSVCLWLVRLPVNHFVSLTVSHGSTYCVCWLLAVMIVCLHNRFFLWLIVSLLFTCNFVTNQTELNHHNHHHHHHHQSQMAAMGMNKLTPSSDCPLAPKNVQNVKKILCDCCLQWATSKILCWNVFYLGSNRNSGHCPLEVICQQVHCFLSFSSSDVLSSFTFFQHEMIDKIDSFKLWIQW